jgi:hypothetical protein
MSDIHPAAIDSVLLSQVTGGAGRPSNVIGDAIAGAVNRVRRTANSVVNRVTPKTTNIREQCGLPDPNGSSSSVVGRTASGEPIEMRHNSPYADCVASVTGS